MTRKQIAYALAAVFLLALGAIVFLSLQGGGGNAALLSGGNDVVAVEIKPTDPIHGSPDAPVTIIEYASLTCPHCADFQVNVLPQLEHEYIDTGRVKLVFRDFPLDAGARMAAASARCQSGDAYFAFIDLLFRNQNTWWVALFQGDNPQVNQETVENSLAEIGRMAGMGRDQVVSCINDPDNLALVDANWQEAQTRYNLSLTPTFIVEGRLYQNPGTFDGFREILDPLLEGK